MSELKYYAKFDGIKGGVKVANFSDCFNVNHFAEGSVRNSFQAINNGQSFRGVPSLGSMKIGVENADATVASAFLKNMLNAAPIKTVTMYESTMLNGAETITYQIDIENAHLTYYARDPNNGGDVLLEVGAFSKVTFTFFTIDQTGKATPSKVTYDITANKVS